MGFLAAVPALGAMSAGMSAVSGIMSIAGGIQQSNALKAEADSAKAAAAEEARRVRRQGEATLSTGRAIAGAQGTTFSGSPLLVEIENAKQAELEAQTKLYEGRLTAFGKKSQAKQALFGGISKGVMGFARAGTTLLTAAPDTSWTKGFDAWDSGGF